jgi:hypothetical protein
MRAPPLLDLMLTSLCFREHFAAKRIRLSNKFLLARRAWLVYTPQAFSLEKPVEPMSSVVVVPILDPDSQSDPPAGGGFNQ